MPWVCRWYSRNLQWSHRLSAMETAWAGGEVLTAANLQWSHRLSAMETAPRVDRLGMDSGPSMGPPPFSDGNADADYEAAWVPQYLQWGHRLSAMETKRGAKERAAMFHLQWGHRLSAMET